MPTATTITRNAVDTLNSLLRTSISATETYRMAIQKIEAHQDGQAVALRVLMRSHADHAGLLRREIHRLGGEPEQSSGTWGVRAKAMEAVASLFGDGASMRALKESEKHAITVALEGLADLEGTTLELVRDRILPSLARHTELLDAIIKLI